MNNKQNLDAYADVENMERFTKESLQEYCELKMQTCQDDLWFIKEKIFQDDNEKKQFCEIGGGNGKLLYALEQEGILDYGVNYEVSESRCKFAEELKKWTKSSRVYNVNADILKVKDDKKYDCIIAVDIVTQFITSLYDEAENDYFMWIKEHLKDGGYAYFELQSFKEEMNYFKEHTEPYTFWQEFPESDPFQYALFKHELDADGNMVSSKLFYERSTGKFEGSKLVIRPYQENEFVDLIKKYGFEAEIHHCYKEQGDLPDKLYLVVARKIG